MIHKKLINTNLLISVQPHDSTANIYDEEESF